MNRIAPAILTVLLSLPTAACCTPGSSSAAPGRGKVEAPVAIDARLDSGTAQVTVRFERAAKDVRVSVGGVDGLAVTSAATPIDGASFDRGGVAAFDVTFTPGAGRSHLAVTVRGRFGGGSLARVATFAVGKPTPEQEKAGGTVIEDPGGERIKVVPGR